MYVPVAGRWVLGDGNRQASPLVDEIHGKSSEECVGEARLFADVHLHDVIALGCSLTTYLRQSSLRRSARFLAAIGPSSMIHRHKRGLGLSNMQDLGFPSRTLRYSTDA